jgi:hypothetical protein
VARKTFRISSGILRLQRLGTKALTPGLVNSSIPVEVLRIAQMKG